MSFNKGFNGGFDLTFLKLGKATPPAIQCAVKLNGIDQYWQLSGEVSVPDGGSIELDLMYNSTNESDIDYVLTSNANSDTSIFFTVRELLKAGSSGYISSVLVDGKSTNMLPYDNKFHTIKCIISGNLSKVYILGARYNYSRNSSGTIKMFRVKDSGGTVLNEIPMTDKTQGATQFATVGDVNAILMGSSDITWDCSLPENNTPSFKPSTIQPSFKTSNTWDDDGNWNDSSDWSE